MQGGFEGGSRCVQSVGRASHQEVCELVGMIDVLDPLPIEKDRDFTSQLGIQLLPDRLA